MATLNFSTYDRLAKQTSMSFGADDAIADADVQAVVDALDAILRGSAVRGVVTVSNVVDGGSAAPPADEEANRGNKWMLRIQDSVTSKIYTHEIGTADNTQLPSSTSDFLDLTAGTGLALKTAVEDAYQSPVGNTGILLSVQQVTRSES